MIVSINGKPGSGKSTVAKKLAGALGYQRHYVGGMRRKAAQAKGMSLNEFNKLGEQSDVTDKEFDEFVRKVGEEKDNFVIESRTAFLFIPHSLKIFLDVSDEVGAKRIWLALKTGEQDDRNEDKHLKSYEDVLASVKNRLRSDALRYTKYYNVDIFDRKHYDLFLDATNLNADQEFDAVYNFVKEKIDKGK